MAGKTIEELEVGMAAELAKTYDRWDIYTFAALTGDLNPAHVDQAFAERTIFKGKIAHGMLTASLISAVLGMKLPGTGCIYLAQDLKFLRPVRLGDTVTAKVVVVELIREKNLARLMTICTNHNGERLLEGTALVMPSKLKSTEREDRATAADEPARRARAPAPTKKHGLLVGQRMTRDPVTVSPDATLREARALLSNHQFRHLPVVEAETLLGMITESDIRQASLPGAAETPAPETLLDLVKVREAMRRDVVTVGPEASIGEAGRLMISRKLGGLPVVHDGRLVGIVTVTDALDALIDVIGG